MSHTRCATLGDLSARAREPETHLLGGVAHGRGGGAGASTQRESSGATLVGEGASRSSPARACATTVARLPAMPTRAVRESPRRSARAGTTPPRETASDDMARARGGTRERGVRCCARTTRSRTKARRGCDGRGPRGKRAQSKVASHFSRCVSACLPSGERRAFSDRNRTQFAVHDSRNRPSNAHMPTWSFCCQRSKLRGLSAHMETRRFGKSAM